MSTSRLIALYSLFAIIAIAVNITTQRLVFYTIKTEEAIFVAMILGAFFGLIAKYLLDRRYIFLVRSEKTLAEFVKYAITGGILTFIFFAFEFTFWILTNDPILRDVGAVVGLVIGYYTKYKIDSRLVFAYPSRISDIHSSKI